VCGYLVHFSSEKTNKENFYEANETLHNRGPDDTGYLFENYDNTHASFGFKRLSILDLNENANQPMQDESKDYSIVFNGEIYNFKELRTELEKKGSKFKTSHSDTEVILEGYKYWKKEVLKKLEGQFSFVIFDKKNNKLFAARDRIGQKPLYYFIDKNNIIFSSSVKSIINLNLKHSISIENISIYLQLGVFPSPNTIYKKIKKLKNAEYMELNIDEADRYQIHKYWEIESFVDYKNFDSSLFNELLEEAVRKRCVADVKINAFLSGGLDSTTITKIASKYIDNLNTYSISNSLKEYDESEWINESKNKLKVSNVTTEINSSTLLEVLSESISAYDEPFSDSSLVPTYLVSKLMSQISKVAISGDGGDELLGGYDRYRWSYYNNFIPNIINKPLDPLILKVITSNFSINNTNQIISLLISKPSYRYESFFVDKNILRLLGLKNTTFNFTENYWVDTDDDFKSMQATDYNFYLPEVMMTKVDRASMENSLEVRSPFLDHVLIEYIMSVNSKHYTNYKNQKIPLKSILSNDFDSSFVNRKKMGFAIPLKNWLVEDLRNLVMEDLLDSKKFVYQQYGNVAINFFSELEKGNKSYTNRIWRLFIVNQFIN